MWIIINLVLAITNGYFTYSNYQNEMYKSAIFNGIACGINFMAAIACAIIEFMR